MKKRNSCKFADITQSTASRQKKYKFALVLTEIAFWTERDEKSAD